MSTLTGLISGGGGGSSPIASIQRLYVSTYFAGTTINRSIASVDTTKTFISHLGNSREALRSYLAILTSSTNVQLFTYSQNVGDSNLYVSLEVIEYV